jgi:hypothetical protein
MARRLVRATAGEKRDEKEKAEKKKAHVFFFTSFQNFKP